MSGRILLALVLALPVAALAAAPAAKAPPTPPLEAASALLGQAFLASIVDRMCGVEPMIEAAAAAARRERPDLGEAELAAYHQKLAATAPGLHAACEQRVREALGGESGPLSRYGARLREELGKSPAPREYEQLRAFLDTPAGRHAEAARRVVDTEAYIGFLQWGQRFAKPLFDELGMMLRAEVDPLPPRQGPAATARPAPGAPSQPAAPIQQARLRNGASLGQACASFYPTPSRRTGEEGSVVLLVFVLPTGRLGGVQVESSSGFPALDVAAAACLGAAADFEPQRIDSAPVASWQRMKWTWRLSN